MGGFKLRLQHTGSFKNSVLYNCYNSQEDIELFELNKTAIPTATKCMKHLILDFTVGPLMKMFVLMNLMTSGNILHNFCRALIV